MALPRRTTREQVLTLLIERTQVQVAKMLGVSVRTIRGWKNEGVKPSKANAVILSRVVRDERVKIKKRQLSFFVKHDKSGKKVPRAIPFVPMAIQITGSRRVYRDFVTNEVYLSDNVFYAVDKLNENDILKILVRLRDSRKYDGFYLICDVPEGGTSPGGRDYLQGGRFGSQPEDFLTRTGLRRTEDLYEIIDYNARHNAEGYVRRIHFIVALPARRVVKRDQRIRAKKHEAFENKQIQKEKERAKKRALKKSR